MRSSIPSPPTDDAAPTEERRKRTPESSRRTPVQRRPRLSRCQRRVLLVVTAALLAIVVVWLVWFSSVLSVREVRVAGVEGPRASEVLAVAGVPVGVPLARLDVTSAEQRVRELPWVASVEIRRGWPSEAVVAVEPRVPVAALESDPRLSAVDASGVVFTAAEPLPRRFPRLRAEGPALEAAVAVLQSLPPDIRDRVVTVAATTRDDVDLFLRSGDEVRWGSADQAEVKADVLRALLKRKADMYDVSAPELPTTFRLN